MKTTTLGQRRQLVSLRNPAAPVPDGDGGYTEAFYALTPPTTYAEIKPATAKDLERVAAGTVLATASHVVTFGFHRQVTTATQIVFENRIFSVTGVSDPEERHVETIALCVELLRATPPLLFGAAFNPDAFLSQGFQTGLGD